MGFVERVDGACWDSSEVTGIVGTAGREAGQPPLGSRETLPTSTERSAEGACLALGLKLMKFLSPNEPGLLDASSELSILLMPKANLSSAGLEPNEEEGEGSGRDPMMSTDSDRGV